MHAFHEIAIGEVPLLEHDAVAGVFQDMDLTGSTGSRRQRQRLDLPSGRGGSRQLSTS
jgi:hypothetical protein